MRLTGWDDERITLCNIETLVSDNDGARTPGDEAALEFVVCVWRTFLKKDGKFLQNFPILLRD